jgi:hypothetical protein
LRMDVRANARCGELARTYPASEFSRRHLNPLPTCHGLAIAPPSGGFRPVPGGVFQVVKTAQSRGRTGRTLLKAPSQLLWPDRGREVYNHCEPAQAVISALRRRPRAARECCGQAWSVTVTLLFGITESSCGQALMLFRWLAADARADRAGAWPSRAVVIRRRRRLDTCSDSSTACGPCPELVFSNAR